MFEFAWPWLFLLLPLPWFIRTFTPPVPQQSTALHVPFYNELELLQRSNKRNKFAHLKTSNIIYLVLWLLLISAAARPQWNDEHESRPTSGRDLLIAMDVSNSMLYSDLTLNGHSISRIDFVKQWLKNFIQQRDGDRLGLILFGSQAYLQAPLTYDHQSLLTWIQEAQAGIAGNTTAIGDALGLAIKRLRQHPADQRVLLLITDGANNSGVMSPNAAAQLAADYQIKIYTVGIGSRYDSSLDPLMNSSSLELDEKTLKNIALHTAGQYFHITSSEDFTDLQFKLSQLEPHTYTHSTQHNTLELYHWPLAIALILSMILVLLHILHTLRTQRGPQEQS
ncbi:VWA domain-containing protein [Denitrificimonas sp. JX-1]|uniref:VWA domain-containing protein n=1 Tax=Denitrificimonas halotolerans TaxID=3098930 RepID=A0ABU5GSX7_9GAMM|nr:VWA domain-containing protein [Denitrificimonas sp. JX-1]MDY7220091.1 VWA domain-containing protein [Denitrificimonas sp. JX-1]